MRKKVKILKVIPIVLLITLAILMLNSNEVYSSSFRFDVTASETRLKAGESTIVTMKIGDIVDVNNLGINALESVLEYDSNVLEVVTQNDMKGINNWTITYNSQKKNFLVSNITSGIKEEQEIGTIKFKVKDNVKPTKTIIRFKDVKSNDGNNLMKETDKQIELTIYEDTKIVDGLEILESGKSKNNEGIATAQIPKAGINTTIIVLMSIVALITVTSYIRYKTIDR